jgi:hypothetical protein
MIETQKNRRPYCVFQSSQPASHSFIQSIKSIQPTMAKEKGQKGHKHQDKGHKHPPKAGAKVRCKKNIIRSRTIKWVSLVKL